MSLIEIVLIGLALSADAVSVTLCNMLANPHLPRAKQLAQPIAFGLFQGVMPVLGFFLGLFAASFIEQFAGVVAFVILGLIGAKMIWDALHENESEDEAAVRNRLSYKVILAQAVATSIDAFAVGVSFCAIGADIWVASGIIALCTCACCGIVVLIGKRLRAHLGMRAQIIGGIVLILIGVKALLF